jgi:hypothetical protein
MPGPMKLTSTFSPRQDIGVHQHHRGMWHGTQPMLDCYWQHLLLSRQRAVAHAPGSNYILKVLPCLSRPHILSTHLEKYGCCARPSATAARWRCEIVFRRITGQLDVRASWPDIPEGLSSRLQKFTYRGAKCAVPSAFKRSICALNITVRLYRTGILVF